MNLTDALQNPVFELISKTTDKPVFVVGGFVRDYLLQRSQKKDIDFVIEGNGMDLAKKVAKALHPTIKVNEFKRFGTAHFHYNGVDYEFVGARKESYSSDSRKPHIEDGTIEDDQKRRDFTINALAISLQQKDYGTLIDPFNGVQDLKDKCLRTPLDPSITFSDDPLRMMRAVRFETELDFTIEPITLKAIQEQSERLTIVSTERIMDEFNKIMASPHVAKGITSLNTCTLLEIFLPEVVALKGIDEVEGHTHKDNFYHTIEVVDNISKTTDNIWLRWAALLHDIGKARTKKFIKGTGWTFHSHEFVGSKMVFPMFKRLRLPKQQAEYVSKLVGLSSRPIPLVDDEVSDSALRRLLFDAGDDLEDLFLLCNADITTKNPSKQERFKKNFELVEEKIKRVEEQDKIRNFQPPISGETIMKTFDLKPGREVGLIKEAIKEAILEGKIKNNEENAFEFMLTFGKTLNLTTNSSSHDL